MHKLWEMRHVFVMPGAWTTIETRSELRAGSVTFFGRATRAGPYRMRNASGCAIVPMPFWGQTALRIQGETGNGVLIRSDQNHSAINAGTGWTESAPGEAVMRCIRIASDQRSVCFARRAWLGQHGRPGRLGNTDVQSERGDPRAA